MRRLRPAAIGARATAFVLVAIVTFGIVTLARSLWNGRVESVPDVPLETLEAIPRREIAAARQAAGASASEPKQQRAAAYATLGSLYLIYRQPVAAASCFRNAAALDRARSEYPMLLAYALRATGQLADAAAAATSALERLSKDSVASRERFPSLCMLAEIAIDRKDTVAAVRYLESAAQSNPHAPYPWIRLGQIAAQSGDAAASAERFARASAAASSRPDLQDWVAKQPRSASGPVAPPPFHYADPVYDSLQALDHSSAGLLRVGQESALEGRHHKALGYFRAAVDANPGFVQARVAYGEALLSAGDRAEAVRQLEEAIRREPRHTGARGALALAWAADPATRAKAVETADALRQDNNAAAPPQLIANIYASAGRYESALAVYRLAAERSPAESWPLVGQAGMLAASGRASAARSLLDDTATRFPRDLRVRLILARFLATAPDAASRDPHRALDLSRELLGLRATLPRSETVAVALAANGNWDEAVATMKQTIARGEREFTASQRERLDQMRLRFEQHKPWVEAWPFRSSFAD